MAGETVITVVGNVTADPELRTVGSGASVVNFTVASTPRTFNRQTNSWDDGEALFLRCSAWRELADHIQASITKGMRVIVQGRLTQRSYQSREGENRQTIELQVDEIGPSLRFATAQVERSARQGGYSNNNYSGGFSGRSSNVSNGNGSGSGRGGYSGGSSSYSAPQPAAQDPWSGAPASGSFGSYDASDDFGGSGDEPEF
jgi:single-strand DNA-binding protein